MTRGVEETDRVKAERYGLRPDRYVELADDAKTLAEIQERRKRLRQIQARIAKAEQQREALIGDRRVEVARLVKIGVMKRTMAADIGRSDMVITQDLDALAKDQSAAS